MKLLEHIQLQEKKLAREELYLAKEKLRLRRADTKRKIELGGLVIKTGIGNYQQTFIFGALLYVFGLFSRDKNYYKSIFESIGEKAFKT